MSFGDDQWNEPYACCRAKGDDAAVRSLESSYLEEADDSIRYYRDISRTLYGRDIPYVLLMHIGAFDAEMLPRLLALYRSRGLQFITLQEAERDPFYVRDTDLNLPLPDNETEADDSKNPLAQSYVVLGELGDILPQAQREARTRGLVLHANSPRPSQTVSLSGYLFTAALARSWPARNLLQDDGAMILLQTGPDQFFIGGTALSVTISVDVETREGIAGIASVEEGSHAQGEWITARRLNSDQDNQGRSVFLPDHQFKLLRVKLYTIPSR